MHAHATQPGLCDTACVVIASRLRLTVLSVAVLLAAAAGGCVHSQGILGSKVVPGGVLEGPLEDDVQIMLRLRTDSWTATDWKGYVRPRLVLDPESCTDKDYLRTCFDPDSESVLHERYAPEGGDWRCLGDECVAEVLFDIPASVSGESETRWDVELSWNTTVEGATVDVDEVAVGEFVRGRERFSGTSVLDPGGDETVLYRVVVDPERANAAFGGVAVVMMITQAECPSCDGMWDSAAVTQPAKHDNRWSDYFDTNVWPLDRASGYEHIDFSDCTDDECVADVSVSVGHGGRTDETIGIDWTAEFLWLLPASEPAPIIEEISRRPTTAAASAPLFRCRMTYDDLEPLITQPMEPGDETTWTPSNRTEMLVQYLVGGEVCARFERYGVDSGRCMTLDILRDDGVVWGRDVRPAYEIACWVESP